MILLNQLYTVPSGYKILHCVYSIDVLYGIAGYITYNWDIAAAAVDLRPQSLVRERFTKIQLKRYTLIIWQLLPL